MWAVREWWMLLFLGLAAILDVIKKEIPVWYLTVGTVSVIILQVCLGREELGILCSGILVGILFLIFSKISKEGIGYGDSWMILILGIFLGIWKLLVVLGIAFLAATVIAFLGIAGKCFTRKSRIPFYPFLFIGYLGIWGW